MGCICFLLHLLHCYTGLFLGEAGLNLPCIYESSPKPFSFLWFIGEEAKVPPVHPSRPEGGQRASAPDGLVLRQAPPAAAALPAATDPQSATAALQLPHHSTRPSQVSTHNDPVCVWCGSENHCLLCQRLQLPTVHLHCTACRKVFYALPASL